MRYCKLFAFHCLRLLLGLPRAYNFVYGDADSFIHPDLQYSSLEVNGRVCIGEGCKLKEGVTISAPGRVVVGRYTSISGPHSNLLSVKNDIRIGSFCSIARGVDFQEYNHPTDLPSTYYIFKNVFGEPRQEVVSRGAIVVGNDVWVGAKASILSGVKIGDGAVVAAHSVVTRDVAPYEIVAGVPARPVGKRFSDDVIEELLKLKWWDWPLEKIHRNRDFFGSKLTRESLGAIK